MGGRDPYNASKGAAEIVFSSYAAPFSEKDDLGAASVRAGNVIGGGDWAEDRIVPDCIRAIEKGLPIMLATQKQQDLGVPEPCRVICFWQLS